LICADNELGCTISLKAAVLPGLKSGRALVKKKKQYRIYSLKMDHRIRNM
jgi:hypothetical protein